MNVIIDKGVLERFVRSKLEEERSFHTSNISEIPAKDEEEPIVPRTQMAVQLSVDEPPVADPEFVPASVVELGNSATVIAREVPSHQIEFFYRKIHKLLDLALDKEEARLRGDLNNSDGVRLRDSEPDLEKFDKREIEDKVRESINRLLREQSSKEKTYGDSWEPEEDWEKEEWEADPEEKSISKAKEKILIHLKPIAGDVTVINPFSGLPGQKQRGGMDTFISLSSRLGPEKVDPVIAQIFSEYNLTPEQIKIVRYAVTQEMMKYKVHRNYKPLPASVSDTDWSPERLAANQVADQVALKMLKGKKDPQTGEWVAPPATQEDVVAELV